MLFGGFLSHGGTPKSSIWGDLHFRVPPHFKRGPTLCPDAPCCVSHPLATVLRAVWWKKCIEVGEHLHLSDVEGPGEQQTDLYRIKTLESRSKDTKKKPFVALFCMNEFHKGARINNSGFTLLLVHPSPSFEVMTPRCTTVQDANRARIKLLHTAHGHMNDSQPWGSHKIVNWWTILAAQSQSSLNMEMVFTIWYVYGWKCLQPCFDDMFFNRICHPEVSWSQGNHNVFPSPIPMCDAGTANFGRRNHLTSSSLIRETLLVVPSYLSCMVYNNHNWLVVDLPLWKIFVSWVDYFNVIWKNK